MAKSLKELIREEYIKCAKDPVYFFKKYCYIQHPHRGKILFNLYDFQEDLMREFDDHRFNVILKSRQLGISTLSAGYSLWMMLFHEDKNILVIATKQEVAKNLVTKVRFMHDEAAFISNIEDIWTSSQSTLSTGGKAIVLSTPNGVGNWFHKIWLKGEAGDSWNPIKLHWTVHPERNQSWRDDQTKLLGEKGAAQECDCDFISSGYTVVDSSILTWYTETYIKDPIEKRGFDGNYWLWEYPNYSRDYVVVADVARGDSSDYSAFHVIDIETVEQVAEYKGKIETKQYGAFLTSVAAEWNNAMLVVENANIGWAVIQEVIDRNYTNLYYSYRELGYVDDDVHLRKGWDLKKKEDMVPGFTMSSRTRPLVISKLDTYMREKTPIVHSKRLIDELFVFIWNGSKAEAQQGYNDDLVMSFSTGLWVRDTALKLRQQGIDLSRTALTHISKTQGGVYNARMGQHNPWVLKDGRGNDVDMTWIL